MNHKINAVFFFIGLALVFVLFQSNRGGRPDDWAGAPGDSATCAACHTSTGTGSISLSGAPATYDPGVTYNMTLTIFDPSAVVGGFQIVATNGNDNTLVGSFTPGSGQRLNNIDRLVQSDAATFISGSVSWPITWTAPSSGAPANLQFYFAGNAADNNFNNGSGDVGYSSSSVLIPLPVELVYFEAKSVNHQAQLRWKTGAEINSAYFEIERSTDGRQFSSIGKVQAMGNAYQDLSYSFTDGGVLNDKTNYYRLKIIDNDGQYEFSEVRSLLVQGAETRRLKIYPNPVSEGESFMVDLSENQRKEAIELGIFNSMGQQVHSQPIDANEAISLSLSLENMVPGVYYVRLSTNNALLAMERLVLR